MRTHSSRLWYAAALPAVALMLATSSFRLGHIYRPNNHLIVDAQRTEVGRTLHYDEVETFDGVTNERVFDVTATAVRREGNQLEVDLTWSADPGVALQNCDLSVVDTDGRAHGPGPADSLVSQAYLCVPEQTPGPEGNLVLNLGGGEPETPPRPQSWQTTTEFTLPDGVEPEYVRIFWAYPEHIRIML